MEKYLRSLGFKGLNIDGFTDVLVLFYADDLVILAENEITLQLMLLAIRDYCDINGLTVNTDQTQVVVFREGGCLSPSLEFWFDLRQLGIVPSYT